MVGLHSLKDFNSTGLFRAATGLLLTIVIWISAIYTDMVCLNYSRDDIIGIGLLAGNQQYGDLGNLRKLGICNVPTHRGCRGSGHRKPIPTVLANRDDIPIESRGVIKNNLISIKTENEPLQDISSSEVKFGLLNARSVRNKTIEITDYVIENELDLVALTETWLGPEGSDSVVEGDLCPNGYTLQLSSRESRGGGVALLFKSSLRHKRVTSTHTPESFEYLEVLIYTHGPPLHIIVVYRPPPNSKNKFTTVKFCNEFSSFLEDKILSTGRLCIVGDFNFHVDNLQNTDASRFCNLLETFDLVQHIKESTHLKGHTLDLIITRQSDQMVQDIEVHDKLISDHHWVHCILPGPKPKTFRKDISYRKVKAIDLVTFEEDIKKSRLLTVEPFASTEEAVKTYNIELLTILDKHAPIINKTVTVHPEASWYNKDIDTAKKQRRAAEKTWRQSKLTIHRDIYIEKKKEVNHLLQSAKSCHYTDLVANSSSTNLFRVVDKISNKKTDAVLPDHDSPQELANKFGDFFKEKIVKIRNRLEQDKDTTFDEPQPDCAPPPLETLAPTTCNEVKKIISESKATSCKLDPIPTSLLKVLLHVLLPVLTNIINMSFGEGCVPTDLKMALIIPLLKKLGLDPEICKHFRPVSNLTYLSKLMERVAAKRLLHHMCLHNLHEIFQSSYKQFHSTETALLRVHSDILTALDKKKCVLLILLDLSAAFDTIDHSTLLSRLKTLLGLTGKAYDWFASYISGRKQSVLIEGVESTLWELLFGVPQGSVLGPILFIIYTSPLGKILKNLGISYHFYADDSQIYISFDIDQADEAKSKIEDAVNTIKSWMSNNFLCLNEDKTEVLLIASKAAHEKLNLPHVAIGNETIVPAQHARNIGFIFDNIMDSKKQISATCKSAWFNLRKIGKIRQYLDRKATEQLVHAFITSKLDLNNSLLYGLPDNLLQRLQAVQNAAARMVVRLPKHSHITPVLCELHWLPVSQRITFKVLLMIFKALNNLAPTYILEMLERKSKSSRSLRSDDQQLLLVPRSQSVRYGDRNFRTIGPKLWNALPLTIRNIDDIDAFKKAIKTLLFNEYYN